MTPSYEKIELNNEFYLVEKMIDSNWVTKCKVNELPLAMQKIEELANKEVNNKQKFLFRLRKIHEIVLFKSKENKPSDITDIF